MSSIPWALSGVQLTSANFALSGWGAGSTISAIRGIQTGFVATITAGPGPSVSPTVIFTYPTAYPRAPLSRAKMFGGTGSFADILLSTTTTQGTFTYDGLPVSTKTYQIAFFTVGI